MIVDGLIVRVDGKIMLKTSLGAILLEIVAMTEKVKDWPTLGVGVVEVNVIVLGEGLVIVQEPVSMRALVLSCVWTEIYVD